MSRKGEYAKFKNYERKIKSSFIIYADFENILVPEDNGKQIPQNSYTNKYQKYIPFSYGYKLVCADDYEFIKPFKKNLEKGNIYSFRNNMIKESKYCSKVIKDILTRNL